MSHYEQKQLTVRPDCPLQVGFKNNNSGSAASDFSENHESEMENQRKTPDVCLVAPVDSGFCKYVSQDAGQTCRFDQHNVVSLTSCHSNKMSPISD